MVEPFARPVKRSVTIAGHETSISLEPIFWQALEREVVDDGKTLSGLIAEIDAARIEQRPMPNLTSSIRQYLFREALRRRSD